MTIRKLLVVPPREPFEGATFGVTIPPPKLRPEAGADFDETEGALPRQWELKVHAIDTGSGREIAEAQLAATIVEASRGALRFQDINHSGHSAIARRGVCAALFRAIAKDDLLDLGYAVTQLSSSDRTGKIEGEFLTPPGNEMWQRFVRLKLAVDDGPTIPYRWVF